MARHSRVSLLYDEIMQELHTDWLSDAPSDCESDKSSNDDHDDDFLPSSSQKGRTRARLEVSDSYVIIDDDDDDVNDGCTKTGDSRNLEQYLGNTGLTFTPEDSTGISELVNHFLANDFLEILLEESDLFHAQHADKHKNSSKSLAWIDVSIALQIWRSFFQ
jgi:hypothetical protein